MTDDDRKKRRARLAQRRRAAARNAERLTRQQRIAGIAMMLQQATAEYLASPEHQRWVEDAARQEAKRRAAGGLPPQPPLSPTKDWEAEVLTCPP